MSQKTKESCQQETACCGGGKNTVSRRDFMSGSAAVSMSAYLVSAGLPLMAGPFPAQASTDENPIPLDKRLRKEWIEELYRRGGPKTYSGWEEQQFIGMPIGGIATGTVYLGGDGKLWCWDIFNEHHFGVVPRRGYREEIEFDYITHRGGGIITEHSGLNYIDPPAQQSPWHFEQGFRVVVDCEGEKDIRPLDRRGFSDISFTGSPPIANIEFKDSASPVRAELEAYTPYVPLDTEASSFPATVMRYTVTNTTDKVLDVAVEGWAENPTLMGNLHRTDGAKYNQRFDLDKGAGFIATVEPIDEPVSDKLPNLTSLRDYGSFAIACLNEGAKSSSSRFLNSYERKYTDRSHVDLFDPHVGGASFSTRLEPGESHEVVFLVAWYFPNVKIETAGWAKPDPVVHYFNEGMPKRWYAKRFSSAQDVIEQLSEELEELTENTRCWRDTWFDSSLPHWLLERAIITANALQTNTCHRFEDGRFWGWEGVGCCPGTCTHVWHYAQSVGRLFPDLERDLRERTDYGLAQRDDGGIDFRGEWENKPAVDGQAGIILRTLREHQMSANNDFLKRVWPGAKKALEFLFEQDAQGGIPDGIPEGRQHNTLDAEWFGKIPVMASLYLASLSAGATMAAVVGDDAFAIRCNEILSKGQKNILKLFDADRGFFVQEEDPEHITAIGVGKGCYIDQVLGQWWAHQLGLGQIYDGTRIRQALNSLWDNNFCPDVGKLRDSIENPQMKGRPYAIAGDAGLVMCTWPKGGRQDNWQDHWQYSYFQECMTGFEYQVASHMIWESDKQPDLLEKGLAITRSIHDRYDGLLRNPYNEIECSDHYARAMSGYSVFLACAGFEYDGPNYHIGFKPRLSGDKFKAAFTAARGWGSYSHSASTSSFELSLSVLFGELELKTLSVRLPQSALSLNGSWQMDESQDTANFSVEREGDDVTVTFDTPVTLKKAEVIRLSLGA